MLAIGLFSIGLALGLACNRARNNRDAGGGAGQTVSVGLNGILVADR